MRLTKQKSAQHFMLGTIGIILVLLFILGLIVHTQQACKEACQELGYHDHFMREGSNWCQSLNHAIRVKMNCPNTISFKLTCTAESKELVYCIKPNWTRTEK